MKDKHIDELEAEGYLKGILAYAKNGIPKAIPLRPVGSDYLSPDSAQMIFQLNDGLGGHAFDLASLEITVDGDTINHEWDPKTGQLSGTPEQCSHETITVQVFGRNQKGNALHPREWTFLTYIGKEARWHGPWFEAFNRGDSLRSTLTPADDHFADKLDSTIYWYKQALRQQPVNPKAAETEYRLGQMYSMETDWLNDESAKAEAEYYFNRVIQFYPTSEFVKSAQEEKAALESVF